MPEYPLKTMPGATVPQTLRDGLMAEYLFRGSADDSSGHARHGLVHGAALAADRFGAPGSAYHFDGVDDFIVIHPPPPLASDAMSVSVWARYDRRPIEGWSSCIIAQDDGVDQNKARRVFQLSARDHRIVWHRMVCAPDPRCRRDIRLGEWYHVVATCANGLHTLYLDAVRQDSVVAPFWTHPDQPLHIGRKGSLEPFFFFRGAIDDVRLWDRALSEDEVRELFAEGGFSKPVARPLRQPGDPISGRWGRDGVNYLDLTLESDGTVHGNVMHGRPDFRAEIASGRYDRETGALQLEGTAPHPKTGELLSYEIKGTLDEDELTISARFGGWSGQLSLTKRGARWPWRFKLARALTRGIQRVLGVRQTGEE